MQKKTGKPEKKEPQAPQRPPKQAGKAKEKDFGGLPDLDPKRFLGCG